MVSAGNENRIHVDATQDDPTQELKQPWKEWINKELEERKRAGQSEEGLKAQEERKRQFDERSTDSPFTTSGAANKAG